MDGVFEDTLSVNNLRIDDTPPTGNGLDDSQIYFYPNPFNPDREVGILRYSLRQSSEVTTKIYDIAGHVVMTLTDKEFQEAETEQGVTWDGKNEAGDLIANGTYLFVIETEAGERGYRQDSRVAISRSTRRMDMSFKKLPCFIMVLSTVGLCEIAAAANNAAGQAAAFLRLPTGARPAGMGYAFTGVADDINAPVFQSRRIIQNQG